MSSRSRSTVGFALVLTAASVTAAQRRPSPVMDVRVTKFEPVIWAVTASAVTSSQATINWTTDLSSDSLVEYGLTTSYGSTTARNTTPVTAHAMTIAGLLDSRLYHFRVRSRDAGGIEGVSSDYTFTTSSPPASILWSADHEEGSLADWYFNDPGSGEALSGTIVSAASRDVAHTGLWSAKATIWTPPYGSVRLFRKARTNPDPDKYAYYSAWYYIPVKMVSADFNNIFAYKSIDSAGTSDPFFSIYLSIRSNGNMYLTLGWWCGLTVEGPHQGESGCRTYQQTLKDVPVARWFHVETYLRQSAAFTGQIIVWQDDVEIFNQNNVKTRYASSANDWLICNYGDHVVPSPFTMYFDDAAVSSARLGSGSGSPPSPMALGERIQTLNATNVRASGSLSGTLLGTQATGALGTIIGGPVFADGYTWWNIDYDTGADGWSGENNYTKVTTQPLPIATYINQGHALDALIAGAADLTNSDLHERYRH